MLRRARATRPTADAGSKQVEADAPAGQPGLLAFALALRAAPAAAPGEAPRSDYFAAPDGDEALGALLAQSAGVPLAEPVARDFGRALGHDVSGVRVHTDQAAQRAARAVDAQAFALGRDLFFSAGAYRPTEPAGEAALAHELLHVAQFDRGELPRPARLSIAPEGSGPERAARLGAEGRLARRGPPTRRGPGGEARLVLRIPADLPQTAGAFRLRRRLDPRRDDEQWLELRGLLAAGDLAGLEAHGPAAAAGGPTLSEALASTTELETAFGEVQEPLRTELRDAWLDDVTTLLAEVASADAPDLRRLGDEVGWVGATYRNLIALRVYESSHPLEVAPGPDTPDWFHTRADVFLTHASITRDVESYRGMLLALAAESERLAHEALEGPVDTARVLVGTILDRGITPAASAELINLYREVIYDEGYDPRSALNDLPERLTDTLGADLLQAEQNARAGGDPARVASLHQQVRDEIATYLATIRPGADAAERTTAHLEALAAILAQFGSGSGLAGLQTWFGDAVRADASGEPAPDTAPDTGATEPPAPAAPLPAPAPPAAPLPTESLDAGDLEAWIRSYWEDRAAFHARTFNGPALLRGMGPTTPLITPGQAQARMAVFRALVIQVLQRLDLEITAGLERAARLHELRLQTFPAPPTTMPGAPGTEAEPPPDFVWYFSLGREAWYLLREAFDQQTYDGGRFIDQLVSSFAAYFEALHLYQHNLERALALTARMRASGADQVIADELPDDFGPAVRRTLALAEHQPAWTTDSHALTEAVGVDYALSRLTEVTDRAERTIRMRREEQLERELTAAIPSAVNNLWGEEAAQGRPRSDAVRPSQVWPHPLRDLVEVPAGFDDVAALYVERGLRQFNSGTLQLLAVEAGAAANRLDTRAVADLMRRIQALQGALGTTAYNEGVDQLQQFAQGQTSYLLTLYVATQTPLSRALNDGRLPGHVARIGRLMQIALREWHLSTLREIVEHCSGIEGQVEAIGLGQEHAAEWMRDTRMSVIFDTLGTGLLAPQELMNVVAEIDQDGHRSGNALSYLLEVEEAGGGEARQLALERFGNYLRDQGTTNCYVAARLIYATALGVADRIHELLKPPEVIDAETWLNQRHVSSGAIAAMSRPPITREEREKAAVVRAYEERSSAAVRALDDHHHPVTGATLTPVEERLWASHNGVSGHGSILPGSEGWSEFFDFAKDVIFMASVGYVTGGAGAAFTEAAGGGAAVSLGVTSLEVGAMTAAPRLRQSLTTGIDPSTPFLEDYLVNAVTMGAERLALGAYNSAFRLPPGRAALGHELGRLAASYAATSVVSRAHLSISSMLHGTPLTDDDVRRSYLTNAAFMVCFKARDLLGEPMSRQLQHEAVADRPQAIAGLMERLRAQDAHLDRAAEASATAHTQVEREQALADAERALTEKESLLRRSTEAEVRARAADFADAAQLFRAEAARARVFGAVNMEPVAGTQDFTYSRGSASERALTDHLSRSGASFQVVEGLHGTVFEVQTPEGLVRFSPREPQLAGGTSAATFVPLGRSEPDVLRSGDHAALARILAADPLLPPDVTRQLRGGRNTFTLRGEARVNVRLSLVDAFSSDAAVHDTGPARYRIEYRDGAFHVSIEALTNASNDQLGRAVDHETREVRQLVDALVRDARAANEPLDRYADRAVLDRVLAREGVSGGTGRPTADEVARLFELRYLTERMRALRAELNGRPTPAQAEALRARLDLAEAELRRTWRASGLSADPAVLDTQLRRYRDAGVEVPADLRNAVTEGSFAAARGWESRGGVRIIDLHIIFAELQRSHPNLMEGVSLADLTRYFNDRIANRAQQIYETEMAQHGNQDLALQRAQESVRAALGPTSIASMRGRAWEGLSAEERNRDPAFRAQHGEMLLLTNPSFPGFDSVTVRGTARGVDIDETPRRNADGSTTAQLRITERGTGQLIYQWVDGSPPTATTTPGFDVGLWSMKARGHYDLGNLYRTMGSAATPHPDARLLTTPNFRAALQRSIGWTQARVATLQGEVAAGNTSQLGELNRLRVRLADLQHFDSRVTTSEVWTNERIDSLLSDLRDRHISLDDLANGLYAGGTGTTP